MPERLSLKDRAQIALALLKDVVIEYVEKNPGRTGRQMDEELGLLLGQPGDWQGMFGRGLRRSLLSIQRVDDKWVLTDRRSTQS